MTNARAAARREDGTAIIGAMMMMVIITGLIAMIALNSQGVVEKAQYKTGQVAGLVVLDSGANKYLQALQNGWTDETIGAPKGYLLNHTVMTRLVGEGNSVLPSSDPSVKYENSELPGGYQYTMAEKQTDGTGAVKAIGYWQIYDVDTPTYDGTISEAHLSVIFRGWVTNGSGQVTTQPRLVRVEYRPGRMSDYQILADGPIHIEKGATISGPVHTNGYEDELIGSSPPGIYLGNDVTCKGGATFSTRTGDVYRDSCNNPGGGSLPSDYVTFKQTTRTGYAVSMLRVQDAFAHMIKRCEFEQVVCESHDPLPASVGGTFDVRLYPTKVKVGSTMFPIPVGKAKVFVLPGDVKIRGTTKRRVTIAAYQGDSNFGAASITIMGSTKSAANGSLGLVSEGDVIVNIESCDEASSPKVEVRAAIVAQSGALALAQKYRTATDPGFRKRCLGSAGPGGSGTGFFSLQGSVVGHFSPLLRMTWSCPTCGDTLDVGFQKRYYKYDDNLYYNPPPFFPTSGPWQLMHWKEANLDCLGGSKCR